MATGTLVDTLQSSVVVPTVSVSNTTVNVGSSATNAVFTVSLSSATSNTVTLAWGTADGTATYANGADVRRPGSLTFNPGYTSQTVSVPINPMTASGLANESFFINLANASNASLTGQGWHVATATLVDTLQGSTVVPKVSAGNVTVDVGNTATYAVVPITLSAATTNTVTLAWGTADGTATYANGAYTPTWGSLTFTPGQTSQNVSVPVAPMTASGLANESFFINLANATNAVLTGQGWHVATATLVDSLTGLSAAAALINSSASPMVSNATTQTTTSVASTTSPAAATTTAPTASSNAPVQASTLDGPPLTILP